MLLHMETWSLGKELPALNICSIPYLYYTSVHKCFSQEFYTQTPICSAISLPLSIVIIEWLTTWLQPTSSHSGTSLQCFPTIFWNLNFLLSGFILHFFLDLSLCNFRRNNVGGTLNGAGEVSLQKKNTDYLRRNWQFIRKLLFTYFRLL